MEINTLLRPFKRRLSWEAAIWACFWGLAAGLAATCILIVFCHVAGKLPDWFKCFLIAAGIAFLTGLCFYFVIFRPSDEKTAGRIDRLGLEERAATMVALRHETHFMAQKQRQDAIEHIRQRKSKEIPLIFPTWPALVCLMLSIVLVGLCLLPAAPGNLPQEETQEEKLVREMLGELRKKLQDASLSEEEQAAFMEQIEALENSLKGQIISLEDLARITEATGEIFQDIESAEGFVSWAFQLTKYPSLREIGEAVLSGDREKMSQACANMSNALVVLRGTAQVDALMERSLAIEDALENGYPTDDEANLCYIFQSLGYDLQAAAVYAFNGEEAADMIIRALQRADKRLYLHFGGEDILEAADGINEQVNFIQMEQTDQQEAVEFGKSESDLEYGEDGQTLQTAYSANPDDWHGAGTGTRDQQFHAYTETIYDPALDPNADSAVRMRQLADPDKKNPGSVPYGQVYETYYAQLIEDMENGVIPEEMMEKMEAYFFGM